MRVKKTHASLAGRIWILVTVLVIFFLEGWELYAWLALGGALGLLWKVLPEEPEEPVEPLPFAHLYKDREIPKPGQPMPYEDDKKS